MIQEKETRKKELEKVKNRLKAQLEEISIKLEDMRQFMELIPNWRELFEESDVSTKRMLLSALIDRIIVTDDEINIKFKISLDYQNDFILESIGSPTIP